MQKVFGAIVGPVELDSVSPMVGLLCNVSLKLRCSGVEPRHMLHVSALYSDNYEDLI